MRSLAIGVLAAALALPAGWLHNARARTADGRAAWERGDYPAAARALDQALELGDGDPTLAFNAGTGHLGAGTPGAALPLLQGAADAATAAPAGSPLSGLRPDALYNLGNAHLAAGDATAAADAYRAALRLAPDHLPAKHNLELALQRNEQQQSPQQQPGGDGDPREGEGEPQPQGGEGEGQGNPPPQPGEQPGGAPQQQPPSPRSSRLPRFDPQEDMSAEQAANLLEAVENLEREQRRAQAEEERRRRARNATEKDW